MAASTPNSDPGESNDIDVRDEAIRQAKLRLTHLEIETHRIKADLARFEAWREDEQADRIADSIGEPAEYMAHDDSPAILRLESASSRQATLTGKPTPAARPQITPPRPKRAAGKNARASLPAEVQAEVQLAAEPHPPDKSISRNEKSSWRKSPPWLVSVIAHAIILLLAMMATFATLPETSVFLTASAPFGEEDSIPELAEFELEPVQFDEEKFEELAGEVSELDSIDFSTEALTDPLSSADVSLPDAPASVDRLASDFGALLAGAAAQGSAGSGASGGTGGGKAAGASFFGAKSRGNRFVFVVDNSGSMVDGRMETTLMELQRSIEALKEDQLFSIIFYSDQVYPLFYPASVEELVPATRENKQKVAQWLPTVEMCVGGRLREAMELVQQLEPQVVYLLSDGDIRSEPLMKYLTEPNDWKFAIHTFGMTVRNPDHLAKLSAIATSHQGQFAPVRVHPAAVQMARQRPIKYNREAGLVWGTKVRPWK